MSAKLPQNINTACQQLLISLHVTLLAISLDILRHILFLRTGNLSLITLFVQCSQSDLTPLRAPCGEAPGRDSNPGQEDPL